MLSHRNGSTTNAYPLIPIGYCLATTQRLDLSDSYVATTQSEMQEFKPSDHWVSEGDDVVSRISSEVLPIAVLERRRFS